MRWSRAHIPTLREAPQEAQVVSHQLMMRAGMIRREASGIYAFLPLGWRSIRKIEQIIRDEMDSSGAQEVSLPVVQPKELWEESGRWAKYGKELGRFTDRSESEFCLQPTAEEAITDLLRRDLNSYRQLPLNLYQIQTKFRDELRPRFGIMRGREFIMKDAYSFDISREAALQSYSSMQKVYRRIFTRTGLGFRPVEADSGAIGGSMSEEFMVLADSGEDELISCSSCDYAANQEKAVSKLEPHTGSTDEEAEEFATPGLRTIEDLSRSLDIGESRLLKTMIVTNDQASIIVVLLRGDDELNLVKLEALLGSEAPSTGLRLAEDSDLESWGLPKGSLGPLKFPKEHILVVDDSVSLDAPYISGANREGFHYKSVVLRRDVHTKFVGPIRNVRAGQSCVRCGAELQSSRGIEVGHVFYLGQKYSKPMRLQVNSESGELIDVEMGCYGIGVGRTLAACIEQNHDDFGIAWPVSMAPYELGIVSLSEGEEAEKLYNSLIERGVDVLWDDRKASAGVKLKDMDLIGLPYQIIVGDRGLKENKLEWKQRKGMKKEKVDMNQMLEFAISEISKEREITAKNLEAIR